MKRNISYKFRLYPNSNQIELINKSLGSCRMLWNLMLNDKINHYESTNEMLYTTPAMYKDEFEYLKEVDSLALANVQLNLDKAYKAFFKGKSKYPTYKSKKNDYGYTTNLVNGNIILNETTIRLPKLGLVKYKNHRRAPDNYSLKSVTISKSKTDKYYISVLFEYYKEIKQVEIKDTIGLDFDIMNFFIDSNNNKYDYPKDIVLDFKKLRVLQRTLSRRYDKNKKIIEQSNNYYKVRLEVAKLFERITNRRNDFLNKLTYSIAKSYDSVCIESLDIKNISKDNKFYAKQIGRFGWHRFITMLEYKLEQLGKRLIKIDKWYPSSKTCSNCGEVSDSLKVGNSIYKCSKCDLEIDRDLNAAINIRRKGLEQLGLT